VVIDAHVHLWDVWRGGYDWLRRPANAAINRTYTFADFASRAAAAGVDRAVLVQADDSAEDTEAMFEVAAGHEEIAGVVAWVPLDRPDEAAAALGLLAARPGFAGIRTLIHDQPDPDWLLRPEVSGGLALLEERDIPFDVISVLPRHLSHVPLLSERFPRLRMVLDHLSHPPLGLEGAPGQWQTLITAAAANPLVFAKVSGLYPAHPSWSAEDLRHVVEFAFELFGPDRLMFGSDWPVAELGGGYAKVFAELSALFAQLPAMGRDAILGGTAARFYRLSSGRLRRENLLCSRGHSDLFFPPVWSRVPWCLRLASPGVAKLRRRRGSRRGLRAGRPCGRSGIRLSCRSASARTRSPRPSAITRS
jgi:L-fuconolactonase